MHRKFLELYTHKKETVDHRPLLVLDKRKIIFIICSLRLLFFFALTMSINHFFNKN